MEFRIVYFSLSIENRDRVLSNTDFNMYSGDKERDRMLAILEDIRDQFFLNLNDPSNPVLSREAIRRLAARAQKEENAKEDERLKEAARIKRENKMKQSKESDEAPEVLEKRATRSKDKEETNEEVGDLFGAEGSEEKFGGLLDAEKSDDEGEVQGGFPFRPLP